MDFSPSETSTNGTTGNDTSDLHHKKNLYPIVRHFFLIVCILAFVAIIALLFYQNGKSIYDNGI